MLKLKQEWDWIIASDYVILSRHKTRESAVKNLFRKKKINGKCAVYLKSDWKKKKIEPINQNFIGVDMKKVISYVEKKERIDQFNSVDQLNRDLLKISSR